MLRQDNSIDVMVLDFVGIFSPLAALVECSQSLEGDQSSHLTFSLQLISSIPHNPTTISLAYYLPFAASSHTNQPSTKEQSIKPRRSPSIGIF